MSDCRHLNLREIESFPIGLKEMSKDAKTGLTRATARLIASFKENSQRN